MKEPAAEQLVMYEDRLTLREKMVPKSADGAETLL